MSGKAKAKAEQAPTPWSEVFHRTAKIPVAFTVHWSHDQEVRDLVSSLDIGAHHQGGVFSTWYWATPLLDGYVLENQTDGFPAGRLPNGLRVVGTRPLRLICHLLGYTQPRRFAFEDSVPTKDELTFELERQQRSGSESLSEDQRGLLYADTASDIALLTYQLFGEKCLPKDLPGEASTKIPAPGEWGEAGFSRRDYSHFQQEGITLDDAKRWNALTLSRQVAVLIAEGVTLDVAEFWQANGVDVIEVPSILRVGATLDEVVAWREAGAHPGNMHKASVQGISLDQMRPYLALGYTDHDAIVMANEDIDIDYLRDLTADLKPKPWEGPLIRVIATRRIDRATVKRWLDLGLDLNMIKSCLEAGTSLESLEALRAKGKDKWQIEKLIRAGKV
jgi:hypothetical protein